ncbi:hypothetical protein AX14_009965 [Amanita brunnescens Koide BX004]|nr:hypothetical protein AX14_009965 [Amanita brunnescens Koide BX004]
MEGAVPFGFSTLNITGKYILNKTLSDDSDQILQLQGIGWITRSTISYASITLDIKHEKDAEGTEHLKLDEYTTTGKLATTTEHRALTWKEAEHEDVLFGSMLAKARRCKPEDIKEDFLSQGWTEDTLKHGLIQCVTRSNTRKSGIIWTANETWGIVEGNGAKRFTRHVYFTGGQNKVVKARLVYDYKW